MGERVFLAVSHTLNPRDAGPSVPEFLGSPIYAYLWLDGRVVREPDFQQLAGSNPGRRTAECNPGKVVYTHVPLSPSSIIWYRPMGGDPRRLGR